MNEYLNKTLTMAFVLVSSFCVLVVFANVNKLTTNPLTATIIVFFLGLWQAVNVEIYFSVFGETIHKTLHGEQ